MGTASRAAALLLCAAALAADGCEAVHVDRLFALRVASAPAGEKWQASLPLHLKAGGGNLNGPNRRIADLALDTDPVHLGSASCHHGPPITSPVPLEARAFTTADALYLEVRWEDATRDTAPGAWRREGGVWRPAAGDEDGIAILWSRATGGFGCQEACHMRDFSLRQGELVDLRAMYMNGEDEWEDAWVWKPSHGARELTLTARGFVTASGELYRTVNSAAAVDPALRPEARRAGTFGPGDRPLVGEGGHPLAAADVRAPAHLYAAAAAAEALTARAEHDGKRWRVVFTRPLAAGGRRQAFVPGGSYRFGLALFDATATNHHIVRDLQTLELVAPPAEASPAAARKDADGVL
ncbi:MAG TPA: ethylbenzene dehydrogenase-related protein [Candidatus Methanoperedens sp.]|nr:ethylbenzene dehydrogenase-related protein [Candidatus Methanoperedens sp.]